MLVDGMRKEADRTFERTNDPGRPVECRETGVERNRGLAKQSFHISKQISNQNLAKNTGAINNIPIGFSQNKSTEKFVVSERFTTIFLRNRSRQRCLKQS
jgi:hypothetical protein